MVDLQLQDLMRWAEGGSLVTWQKTDQLQEPKHVNTIYMTQA